MRTFLIGILMLAAAPLQNIALAENRTECVLRSQLERDATKLVEDTARITEKERGVVVSQAAKDTLKQMVIEMIEESYKVVETEADCPVGMLILRSEEGPEVR